VRLSLHRVLESCGRRARTLLAAQRNANSLGKCPLNCKAKGSRNERRTMRLLQAAGYRCTRSGASLGVFDVIAIGPDAVQLIQVKTGKWPSRNEMKAIQSLPAPPNCRRIVHRWMRGATQPDVSEVSA
jgi:hypothetical protein